MIKVDLISGFLGAGKTTFLKKYARYLINKGEKIGILEYDMGALNIDMLLLGELRGPKCELEMLAAACDKDCLERRFRTKLIAMAMSGYNRVIIEPSGVFDMDMFFDSLREEPLENWYEIGSIITVVSGNLSEDIGRESDYYLASQAASAGCVVLSKTQNCSKEEIVATKKHIRKAAEEIKCNKFFENYLDKDWDALTEEDFASLESCGYHVNDYVKLIAGSEDTFASVSFLNVDGTLEELKEKIEVLFNSKEYGNIYRVKGFIAEGQRNYEINATLEEVKVTDSKVGQGTVIVIGTNLNEQRIRELILLSQ